MEPDRRLTPLLLSIVGALFIAGGALLGAEGAALLALLVTVILAAVQLEGLWARAAIGPALGIPPVTAVLVALVAFRAGFLPWIYLGFAALVWLAITTAVQLSPRLGPDPRVRRAAIAAWCAVAIATVVAFDAGFVGVATVAALVLSLAALHVPTPCRLAARWLSRAVDGHIDADGLLHIQHAAAVLIPSPLRGDVTVLLASPLPASAYRESSLPELRTVWPGTRREIARAAAEDDTALAVLALGLLAIGALPLLASLCLPPPPPFE